MPAQLFPSDLSYRNFEGHAIRQWDTLEVLRDNLPSGYSVFHGLHWSRLEAGLTVSGQLQFVILTPAGGLVCMLMRTGLLQVRDGSCFKKYMGQSEDVIETLHRDAARLVVGLRERGDLMPHVEPLLYCPDFKMVAQAGLGLPNARILDSSTKDSLVPLCIELNNNIQEQGLA
ncbi:MAG: hypothetical protein R3194_07280, partial [Limnobacter sp.]|nr:hypothetical protein [Limnobacter sp.]